MLTEEYLNKNYDSLYEFVRESCKERGVLGTDTKVVLNSLDRIRVNLQGTSPKKELRYG